MKLQLNIEEDEELRTYIKQTILAQAKAITREEMRGAIREEIARIIDTRLDYYLNKMIQSDAVTKMLNNSVVRIKSVHSFGYYNDRPFFAFVEESVQEEIRKIVDIELIRTLGLRVEDHKDK